MALSTVARVKVLRSIPTSDTSQDALIAQVLAGCERAIASYCKRVFESTTYSGEIYTGSGTRNLLLRQWPVTAVASVYLHLAGHFGQGSDPFPASTLLTSGEGYVLQWKSASSGASQSDTGILVRLHGTTTGGDVGWFPSWGWHGGGGGVHGGGGTLLFGRRGPVWPTVPGCIKVTYTAGFVTIPDDLKMAADAVTVWALRNLPNGGYGLTTESLEDYSYNLAAPALGALPELGSARQILATYRRLER